ncbi:MAG: ABC transporter substrate-binding protein [bacterium]
MTDTAEKLPFVTGNSIGKIIWRSFTLFIWFLLLYPGPATLTLAQEQNHKNARQIIIGDTFGRTDIRELKIMTRQGEFAVFDQSKNKPFDVAQPSPDQLVITFKKSEGLKFYNPNRIIYKFYNSERALISALILDRVDVAILENEASASEVEKSNDHILPLPIPMTPNTVKLVCYNNGREQLKSRKVRVALAYAIDHKRIIKKILGNKAHAAKGPFDIDSPLIASGLKTYNYHPKIAIQLLREAGWEDADGDRIRDKDGKPLRFTLYYQKGMTLDEQISRQIKIDLFKVGVDVNPKPLSKREINDRLRSGEFDAVLMGHTFENDFTSFLEFFAADGSENYMLYRSNQFKNYLRFYSEANDPNRKKTLRNSLQHVVNKDQPVNFLYFKWTTHYMINVEKLDNYRDKRGKIRPYEQWILKSLLEK